MHVTQTRAEGLKREYQVSIGAKDLDDKLVERLTTMKDQIRINGFRPGKVPLHHLRRVYGRAVMAEVIEQVIADANRQIADESGARLAAQPKVTLPEDQAEVEGIIAGQNDLMMTVAVVVLPQIEVGDLKELKLERLVGDVSEAEIDEAIGRIAEQNRPFSPKAEGAAAENGDRLTVDFTGTIDGTPFDGGTGEGITLVLGSNTFIPGFEDALVGAKTGETRTVRSTFPERYLRRDIAGREAEFEVNVKLIEAPGELAIDDDFAKTLGLEGLDALKEGVRTQMARDLAGASRTKLKRKLLDALDGRYSFELPPSLVDQEFDNIWRQVMADLEASKRSFADEETTEEEARAEYRRIAERRVRLGLLLAQIGERNNIEVKDDEVGRALAERTRQFPGRERVVWDYYRNNPGALAELRAPLFEDKVVDYILELAEVSDRKVGREELLAEDEEAEAPPA
jgi:trigger factor